MQWQVQLLKQPSCTKVGKEQLEVENGGYFQTSGNKTLKHLRFVFKVWAQSGFLYTFLKGKMKIATIDAA